jgi:hypothetical protein
MQISQTMHRLFRRIITCLEVLGTRFAAASPLEWDEASLERSVRPSPVPSAIEAICLPKA